MFPFQSLYKQKLLIHSQLLIEIKADLSHFNIYNFKSIFHYIVKINRKIQKPDIEMIPTFPLLKLLLKSNNFNAL